MRTYEGQCHCGAIGYSYATAIASEAWPVRACQCAFCRAHGAMCTSDPQGAVRFRCSDAHALSRYVFGLRSAEFLVCGRCGVYIAAVMTQGDREFTTINLRAMTSSLPGLPEAAPVSYEAESLQQRIRRRARRWTPVLGSIRSDGGAA